jgi:oligoribonuclease NrnB/cAMP/cGMP phosphodiesterase (DHH superfamily)
MPPRVLPHHKWFLPDAYHDWRFRRAVDRAVSKARSVLHVADGDLDGAGCDVMVRLARGEDAVATFYTSPYDFVDVLERVASHAGGGRTLAVSDLSPNRDEVDDLADRVEELHAGGWDVVWRDHHHEQWPDEGRTRLREAGVDLVIHEKEELCTADLVRREEGVDSPFARRLATVVRDHDLWLQEDPQAEVLSDACHTMGPRDLVEHLLATRDVDDPAFDAIHAESEEEREAEAEWGLERAKYHEGDEAKVGVTYGSGPTNDTLHRMQEEHDADLGVMLRPEGSFSLRSRDEVEVCHEVAQAFDGGGHPNASGGTLGLSSWEMPRYWLLQVDDPAARELVEAAVERVDEHLADA